jgi:hypothetical protein
MLLDCTISLSVHISYIYRVLELAIYMNGSKTRCSSQVKEGKSPSQGLPSNSTEGTELDG